MRSNIILILATVLYSLVHSLTATNRAKNLARNWLSPLAERWYRVAYNIFAGISFIPILWLLAVLPDHPLYTIPMPWLLLTMAGQFAGAVIIVVGILQTGGFTFIGIRQIFTPRSSTEDTVLVTTGLYTWVRHPLYTGGLLILWLTPVMTCNLLTLSIVLTLYLFIGARLEEGRMVQAFGDAYRAYQAEVPMILPFWFRSSK